MGFKQFAELIGGDLDGSAALVDTGLDQSPLQGRHAEHGEAFCLLCGKAIFDKLVMDYRHASGISLATRLGDGSIFRRHFKKNGCDRAPISVARFSHPSGQ